MSRDGMAESFFRTRGHLAVRVCATGISACVARMKITSIDPIQAASVGLVGLEDKLVLVMRCWSAVLGIANRLTFDQALGDRVAQVARGAARARRASGCLSAGIVSRKCFWCLL